MGEKQGWFDVFFVLKVFSGYKNLAVYEYDWNRLVWAQSGNAAYPSDNAIYLNSLIVYEKLRQWVSSVCCVLQAPFHLN